ncbi:MAG TPA: hypothetical protein VF657_02955 [Actinoplanes sp.]|jgi:hypothetical protein
MDGPLWSRQPSWTVNGGLEHVGEQATAPPRRKMTMVVVLVLVVLTLLVALVVRVAQVETQRPAATPARALGPTARYVPDSEARSRLAEDLVQRREDAVRNGDAQAWLADIDPANAGLLAQERMRFDNLRQFRFTTFDLRIEVESGPSSTASRPAGPLRLHGWVHLFMRFAEDVQLSMVKYDYTLVFDNGRAVVAAIDAWDNVTAGPYAPELDKAAGHNVPWDLVALRSARGQRVTVLAPTADRWDPAVYLPAAQRAEALVRSLWKDRPGPSGFLVFLADDRQFAQWFNSKETSKAVVGYATFTPMVDTNTLQRLKRPNFDHKPDEPAWDEISAGARIVLRMSAMHSTAYAEQVLAHEMAHAVGTNVIQTLRTDESEGATNQPSWAVEGFARYVEHLAAPGSATRALAAVRRAWPKYKPTGDRILPASNGFYSKNNNQMSFNYNLGSSMFHAADKVGGRQKAVALYIAVSNNWQMLSESKMFLDITISQAGLNPARFWRTHKTLVR